MKGGALALAWVVGAGCGDAALPPDREAASWYEDKIVDSIPAIPADQVGQVDVYLDFSNGMGEGMKASQAINLELINFLVGRKTRAFRVGAAQEPVPIDLLAPSSNLLVLKNFSDTASHLRPPLDSVIAHPERTVLYVTDFERVLDVAPRPVVGAPKPHSLDVTAWGQDAFKAWLSRGNRIDIFAFPYEKPVRWFGSGTVRNHVYYILFTTRAEVVDPKAFRNSLLGFLSDRFERTSGNGVRFSYWADDIGRDSIVPGPPQCRGNINLPIFDCGVLPGARGADWYQLSAEDLIEFRDNAAVQDKRIVTLRLEPRIGFLDGGKLGIRVTDVTSPVSQVAAYLADSAAQGPVERDTMTGEPAAAVLAPPTAANLTPAQSPNGVFALVVNPTSKEVGITLDPSFAGVSATTLYRVDIVLEAGRLADQSRADEVLLLNYAGGYQIRSLGESVKFALRDVVSELAGRALHSVYIRVDK